MATAAARASRKPKMAYIWMVRHGQAVGNGHHLLNGNRIDAPLTAEGKRQAKKLAREWKKNRPDVLLSSPLTRAVATARELSRVWKMPIKLTKLAEEQDYGNFTGQTIDSLVAQRRWKGYFHVTKDLNQIYTLRCPHGENWAAMKKRAAELLRWLDRHYAGKRVVVVSHSDFINCCYGVRFGLGDEQTFRRKDRPNCGWVRL
ncbi:MAG: histidine phosphatase family protein [Candidatus Micrarchaeota archaeon]|nr:histidine phosphatase family protein [Candidatus Micrarchaeota archaeon]